MSGYRRIVHIDMDAFFASVEQRDDPSLRGKPVAVGGSSGRAVVAAASYEARAYGVHSAMPLRRALALCPELQVVPGRFDAYRRASTIIREILQRYTDLVEPLALDEAYLDVTAPKVGPASGTLIASAITSAIREETGLSASAGVATGKFLAKIASGMRKPGGLTVIRPEEMDAFLLRLPVGKFFGVGPATRARMHALGLFAGADLRRFGREALLEEFGKVGGFFHEMAWGRDDRPVEPNRPRKSIGAETTFEVDRWTEDEIRPDLTALCREVSGRLERTGCRAKTVTVKLRYSDFTTITRSQTLLSPVRGEEELLEVARLLAFERERPRGALRLLGVIASQLIEEGEEYQPPLPFAE